MAVANTIAFTEINVAYKEDLGRTACYSLLVEAIKYLLYERHQIPLPYEQVKRTLMSEELGSGENAKRKQTKSCRTDAKKRQLRTDLEELFVNLEDVFLKTDVFSVCVMFGPTQVSPKETFIFQFPSIDENATECTAKTCGILCRKLIRTLISNEGIQNMKEISPTSMFVALQIHRETCVDWFVPKRTFKPPHRGQRCYVEIATNSCKQDLKEGVLQQLQTEDLLWFLAPVTVKGYKEVL